MELQQSLEKIRKQGLGLAAVSYDSVAVLRNFAARKGIAYPLLSDPDSKVIRGFGLFNDTIPKNSMAYGIPYPGTFILDNAGVVAARYFEADFRQRYTASEILVQRYGDAAGASGETAETRSLRLTSSASLATVHWGERLALEVEIRLKPGMHVYAPGTEGYIPVELKLTETPAFQAHPVVYPTARKLYLKPIRETAPVYEGRFRLLEDITIAPEPQVKPLLSPEGVLTVRGGLRYQACDARICYAPETVPLTWTFHYQALDRQRAPAELQHQAR